MRKSPVRKEIELVKARLKELGLRWTKQRELIVEQALLTHSHFSAEDLFRMIEKRCGKGSAHLATVYRTLQVLEEEAFIQGLEARPGEGRLFEHVLGHDHHDHVICLDCGKIFEFQDPVLERHKAVAARNFGLRMEAHSLRIHGFCETLALEGRCKHKEEREGPRH